MDPITSHCNPLHPSPPVCSSLELHVLSCRCPSSPELHLPTPAYYTGRTPFGRDFDVPTPIQGAATLPKYIHNLSSRHGEHMWSSTVGSHRPAARHLKVLRCWIGFVVHACNHSAHQGLIEGCPTIFSTVRYRMPYNALIPRMIRKMLSHRISIVVSYRHHRHPR